MRPIPRSYIGRASLPNAVVIESLMTSHEGRPAMSTGASPMKGNLPNPGTEFCDPPATDVVRELESLRDRFRKTTNALASAAHDLKTPLAIMNGYIELLQSQKLGPLNERQREVMADMSSSGQRLQHFIQDFLTYTVLETGELRMQFVEG